MTFRQLIFVPGLLLLACASPNSPQSEVANAFKVDAFQVTATPTLGTVYLTYHLEGLPGFISSKVVFVGPIGTMLMPTRAPRPLIQPNVQKSDTFRIQFPDTLALGSIIPAEYYFECFFLNGDDTSAAVFVSDSIGVAVGP